MVTETPIIWTYGSASLPDVWIANLAATLHVSSNWDDFSSYWKYDEIQDIKAFGNNIVKGVGEGNIIADIEFKGKLMRICLTQVMHIPSADRKILSLKRLDQNGFEIHNVGGHIHIMRTDKVYAEHLLVVTYMK